MSLVIRGAKLFPASHQAGSISFASAFIYEPHPSQRELGELYAVVEILSSAKNPSAVADLIIESFGKAFYSNKEEDEEVTESDSAARFDSAVKATNSALAHYTGHDDASWIGKASIVIAVAAGNELHVTHTGSTEAYLLRRGHLARIDSPDQEHKHQTHKPFTSIASGQLEPGDRLVLSTPALLRVISKDELKDLLTERSANAAANKIAELIENENGAERVAAVIAEATTADLIAGQPLPHDPPEVMVGPRGGGWKGTITLVKEKAVPILKKAHKHAKPLAGKAIAATGQSWHYTKTTIAPKARHHGLKAVAWLRSKLRNPKEAKVVIALGVVAIILIGVLIGKAIQAGGHGGQVKLYDQALTISRQGQQLWLEGNKDQAKVKLESAQKILNDLAASKPGKKLDQTLAKRSHEDFDPASVSGLSKMIQDILDQIAGLTRISPKDLADLSSIKDSNPSFMELLGNQLVVVGGNDSPKISLVNTSDGKLNPLSADTSKVGKVVDTAPTSGGIYLLTAEPAVWFFKTSDSSLTKQAGGWQAGKAIATFGDNAYILSSNNQQILRYAKSGSGFGSPSNYLTGAQGTNLAGAADITVDGSVLCAGSNKLLRFFTGTLSETASGLPEAYKDLKQVISTADGEVIVFRDGKTGQLGTADYDGSKLTFSKQYVLTSGTDIKSISASSDGVTGFALYQGKIVRFSLI